MKIVNVKRENEGMLVEGIFIAISTEDQDKLIEIFGEIGITVQVS